LDLLTAFGLFAVTAMLVSYALEDRSPWYVLAFAASCALGSLYGFLQGGLAVRIGRGGVGAHCIEALGIAAPGRKLKRNGRFVVPAVA